jgi:two-component system cell cycle sensor histidine kinase/response regulator CckA
METPAISILLVEDNVVDAELILRALRLSGLSLKTEPHRVDNERDYLAALDTHPDVILSDYALPGFSGLRALELLRERGSATPFILISATIGDEIAVQAIKLGASDYLIKDRLGRLHQSISSALANARLEQERRQAVAALQRSEEMFRQLAEHVRGVFWISNPEKNQILYISPGYERVWGRTCESLYAHPTEWMDAIHPDDQARIREAVTTRQTAGTYNEEYRIVRPDGKIRWVQDHCTPVRNEYGRIERLIGAAEDITERRELEEQFRQAQKMEAIGRLAGGIAHDFNNLLTAINGYSELLMETSADRPAIDREALQEISSAGRRAADLTSQLLAYSRRIPMSLLPVDLNKTVREMEKMLHRLIGEDIKLTLNLRPSVPSVHTDPTHLQQIILNLTVNARDAMPEGGALVIATEVEDLSPDHCRLHPGAKPGPHVVLTVTDSGIGMSEETRAHLFEPFFTTKSSGKGTGLGLSTVYGIVKQSNGHITVQSTLKHGTAFRIFLPALAAANEELAHSPVLPEVMPSGHETIMLVEDNATVRGLANRVLCSLGYRVFVAGHPSEAIAFAQRVGDEINLLVSDVVMPGINGYDLAAALRRRFPALKVLFMSGHTDHVLLEKHILKPNSPFLQKPFAIQTFARKVRDTLDLPAPPL